MLNILIADDNIYYVKNLVNFVIGKNSNIKISNIASNGLEVLDILQRNPKIDLILLDLKMPKLNGIDTLNKIYNAHLKHCPKIIIISGENHLINKIVHHPLITDIIDKTETMDTIYSKLKDYENSLNYSYIREDLARKIYSELIYIGYSPSHLGTQYIKECILEIYENKNYDILQNLESYVYKKIAYIHGKSIQNIKSNIVKATNFMYLESDISVIRKYFHFSDNQKKPSPKKVISTILNNL